MKINSIDKDVKKIFESGYYTIPRFQRPYSWDRENVSDLWTDTIVDSEGDYFIGSMVVFKAGSDTYGIVDGQQRLTTITMMMCALRNALESEGFSSLATGIHYLVERPNIDNKPQYVLSPETSFPYFQEHIQKRGQPEIQVEVGEEEKGIQAAFDQIQDMIRGATNAIKGDTTIAKEKKAQRIREKLVSIRDKILSLKLIWVELDDEDDAYVIFETLNTRGKDLSVSDLVKSYLTKLIKTKNAQVDPPKLKWERILSTIEGSAKDIKTEEFLHHYWLSKHDYVTLKKLFREIKRVVKKEHAPGFLDELVGEATTYREIHETSFRKWKIEENGIRQSLDAFGTFRIKQQVPMVLSVMRDYKVKDLKKKHVESILSAIENFHFIFTAVTSQRSSGGISQMYASCAKKLVSASTTKAKVEVISELHQKLRERVPSHDEFLLNFKEIYFTNNYTKQKELVRYILSRMHAFHSPAAVTNYEGMTIEHLMPQSAIGTNNITEQIVGQLGNLIFVPPGLNTKLGNKAFSDKIDVLLAAGVKLDGALLSARQASSQWSPSDIDLRTEWLAKLAYEQIWKL